MRRGLRTIVYDDTIPEEQSYESVMPSQAPVIDNYMPEIPGMEDPSLRQVELAEGGVVQREGFDQGGDVKKLKKYLSNDRNKFITEFTKYTNKYFYGNLKRAAESIGERRNKIRAIYERKGIKNSGYGSKTPTEVFVGGEKPEDFSTKLKKEPNILDKFKNKDTFVDANVLAKKFGVDVSTKNKRDVFIGFLKRAGVDKQNFSGKMNLYNIGDAAKKLPETFKNKKVKGETLANSQRVSIESELDPDLKNFKQRVIKEIGKVSNKFDIYIPNAVEDVGHAVSIKQASKYPNLFKNSNTVSLQSLVFQDPEINRQILSKNMEGKFDSVYKELNDLVDKKITPESRAKLIQLNKKLSNLRNETISKIKNLSKENKYFKGQEKRIPLIEIDLPKIGETFKSQNLKANMSVVDDYYRYGNIDQINPTANKLADLSPKELSQFENKVISQYSDNAKKYYLASGFPQKEVSELGEMIDTRVANERIDTQVGEKKIKTIVENIGCPTGSLKAANGANCYIKGAEKIQAGKLNQNEFNVLQKAVKSPAVAKAVKYGGVALKGLGALFAPLMVYDTYTEYKKGKPISEALEYGLLGTNIIGGTRDEMKLTPQEREARGVQQQYEREQQDVSGLSSDFYFPSDLSVDQAAKIYEQGQDRVAAERAAEEEQAALENVYQGDPGILDYSEYAYGGRVGLEKGSDPKDKPILPINPMIGGEDPRGSLQDPGRRDVLKGMGLLGAGVAAGKLGLLKLGKAIKKAPLTNIVKPMGKTMTQFPKWFPTLINRIRKEGKQIPIYKEVEVTLTKPEYDKLSKEGVTVYDRHLGRTDWYKEKLIKEGVPRYYTDKKTDEIIGYKYEVKDLPGTIVKEMNGEEIRVYFPNAYGRNVEMTYKAPKVSVDMKGKKVKYDAEFEVNDAVPEMAGPEDVPDFFPGTVDNLDDVYGGASKIEQYALKLKKPRTTQGDEVVNAWDAGQPHMSLKELKKQKKQGRRDYAKQQVDEKPATFEDREFLKNFLDAGDDID
jgi:hypothetical protein